MKKYYYRLWADAIYKFSSKKFHGDWKFNSLLYISMAMSINLCTVIAIAQRWILGKDSIFLEFDIVPGRIIDDFLAYFVTFMLLPLVVNYFLIIWNSRHVVVVQKYQNSNGRLATTYILISLFLPIALLIIGAVTYEFL